jgi:hypothetical protein
MPTTINGTTGIDNVQDDSVDIADLSATGTPSASTYLRGDNSWATVAGYTNSDALTLFNASGSAPVYACRAWVNFDGTGTPSIRGSGNISSITDNNTGRYTVNMTTAISDTNYAVTLAGRLSTGTTDNQGYANLGGNTGTYSTTAFTVNTLRTDNDDFIDAAIVGAAVFR